MAARKSRAAFFLSRTSRYLCVTQISAGADMNRLFTLFFALIILGATTLGAVVRGVVISDDGTPLGGARITILPIENDRERLARWSSDAATPPSVSTDARGRFSV